MAISLEFLTSIISYAATNANPGFQRNEHLKLTIKFLHSKFYANAIDSN